MKEFAGRAIATIRDNIRLSLHACYPEMHGETFLEGVQSLVNYMVTCMHYSIYYHIQEAKLTDQLPLIIVCDRFDLVRYLALHASLS